MPRRVFIGADSFETIQTENYFYVDKTDFIRQWWDQGGLATAIMRPRRFGKTLTMDMVRCFFSTEYAGRGDLFEGLSIWNEEKFRAMQGTYPVLFLSFAEVKKPTFETARDRICLLIKKLYLQNRFILDCDCLAESERDCFRSNCARVPHEEADVALRNLMDCLSRYYGKKVIMLLDEYDTPLQEAYANGYWEQLVAFLRPLFGTTFKGNPYLERGLMTGITRVAKESIFSDLNNLEVVTTTSGKYADCFGFTQPEVDAALEEFGLAGQAGAVKDWYDGFTFGSKTDIYNPWSITNFLRKKELEEYWANTSANSLVSRLVREGSGEVKMDCERLLAGESIEKPVDEQIVFSQLASDSDALWSFLLASGYLKVLGVEGIDSAGENQPMYKLALTNGEVRRMFRSMVEGWFRSNGASSDYQEFLSALRHGDVEGMNYCLNRVTESSFSYFDTGGRQPERFYHGFVLGLMVSLDGDYYIHSNRESGRGRYDVVLEPKDSAGEAIIIELKTRKAGEKDLEEAVQNALAQIEEKGYAGELMARGFAKERIRRYGFAFDGKTVLVG